MRIPPRLQVFFITKNETIGRITGGLPAPIAIVMMFPIIRRLARNHVPTVELVGAAFLGMVVLGFFLMMAMNFAVNRLGPERWRR